jgi:hypothetical protein
LDKPPKQQPAPNVMQNGVPWVLTSLLGAIRSSNLTIWKRRFRSG